MAKSIPRNILQVFCSAVRTKPWKKERKRDSLGSILPCRECVYFLQEKEPGTLCFTEKQRKNLQGNRESFPTVKKEASNGYPAKGYSRLLHWSYKNFLNVFLIYSGEIRRMVPGKTSGTHFPDAAAHSPGQGSLPPSARDIPSYIRPVCSGASFFLSGVRSSVCSVQAEQRLKRYGSI